MAADLTNSDESHFGKGGPSFRPAVGALVFDAAGRLLVGRRNDSESPHWQFPQGGMDENENAEEAVLRELYEELGTRRVKILGLLPRRTRYVWAGGSETGLYDGQSHIWFVLRLEGEIEEDAVSEEFDEFSWIDPKALLDHTHPVRRATYFEVYTMLMEWLETHGPVEEIP